MNNKFFFGAVVGFFLACVVFVVVLFFSGTVKAEAMPGSHQGTIGVVSLVDAGHGVTNEISTVTAVPTLTQRVTVSAVGAVSNDVPDYVNITLV